MYTRVKYPNQYIPSSLLSHLCCHTRITTLLLEYDEHSMFSAIVRNHIIGTHHAATTLYFLSTHNFMCNVVSLGANARHCMPY